MDNADGNHHSFFNVFQYGHMMEDAIDGGLVYEDCTILRDVTTASGLKLTKGDYFESVWMLFREVEFQFMNWKPRYEDRDCGESIPDESSVNIPIVELAPMLHWCSSDMEYHNRNQRRRMEESQR